MGYYPSQVLVADAKAIWIYLVERKQHAQSDRLFLPEEGTYFPIDGINSW